MNIKEILQQHGAHSPELEQQLIIAIQGDCYRPPIKSGLPLGPQQVEDLEWIDTDEPIEQLMCGYFVGL